MSRLTSPFEQATFSRRELLRATLVGGGMALSGLSLFRWLQGPPLTSQTFIGKANNYDVDMASIIRIGLHELGISEGAIKGKRILLKPNLVEPHKSSSHINTHPLVIRGAIEAFLSLGARSVIVGEGAGHRHDSLIVLENSGLGDILYEDRIPFKDLNTTEGHAVPNLGGYTTLKTLTFPRLFNKVDWIVSLAKMKTHHWGRCHLVDEKPVRRHARDVLWVAQKCSTPRRHTAIYS